MKLFLMLLLLAIPVAGWAAGKKGATPPLMWAKDANIAISKLVCPTPQYNGGRMNWQQAIDCVKALNNSDYQGYSDWRLPTIKELIAFQNKEDPCSSKNKSYVNVEGNWYWSSTTSVDYPGNTNYAWRLGMNRASDTIVNKSTPCCFVWPVRTIKK